ncbi:MAG: hypothetical protein KDD39_10740 [Bdellovibrionales bacterium]|nr:hypothetical protein [Bdellovibrionales bacterium]
MKQTVFILFLFSFLAQTGLARTLSSSGTELAYEYTHQFRSLLGQNVSDNESIAEAAEFHAAHLFGLFHSPEGAEAHGYFADLVEGFAGTKHPTVLKSRGFRKASDPYLWIEYTVKGKMLVLKDVAKDWMGEAKSGTVALPLLSDLPAVYTDDGEDYRKKKWKKCTDSHYSTAIDFSYFYNPFRCEELGSAPIAAEAKFSLQRTGKTGRALFPQKELAGDNGNGPLVTLYFVSGFDDTPAPGSTAHEIQKDAGYQTFASIERLLTGKYGFKKMESLDDFRTNLGEELGRLDLLTPVTLVHDTQRRYFSTFVKKAGKKIFVARSALFDTHNEVRRSPLRSFPKYWKEAWKNGDVIYFGGHSGDGQSLSLENMLSTLDSLDLDEISFQRKKKQVALFDSCSSYAHYQEMYVSRKPEGLHLITFGLVSLFEYAGATLDGLMALVLTPEGKNKNWTSALHGIEKRQLPAHVKAFYEASEQKAVLKEFEEAQAYPSSLMNVWVP